MSIHGITSLLYVGEVKTKINCIFYYLYAFYIFFSLFTYLFTFNYKTRVIWEALKCLKLLHVYNRHRFSQILRCPFTCWGDLKWIFGCVCRGITSAAIFIIEGLFYTLTVLTAIQCTDNSLQSNGLWPHRQVCMSKRQN